MSRVNVSYLFAAALLVGSIPLCAQNPLTANAPSAPPDHSFGTLETVAIFNGPMPTGVTVSRTGRIFVNFPRWGDPVPFTVAEIVKGKAMAFPDQAVNNWPGITAADPNHFVDVAANATHFISVQSVVVDPADRLWVLDTGAPKLKDAVPSGPKLVAIDLKTNRIVRVIVLPVEVAGLHSYMNDIRFDLRSSSTTADVTHGDPPAVDPARKIRAYDAQAGSSGEGMTGFAYITDSSDRGPNGIVVVDLATGRSWRRLNNHFSTLPEPGYVSVAEGKPLYQTEPGMPPKPVRFGSDGIAISADGAKLYYCTVSSTALYEVSTAALRNLALSDDQVGGTVKLVTGKGPSDGLESDAAGNVYAGDYSSNSIERIAPSGMIQTIVHDPRLLWPDTMSLADDGYLYVNANQLNRQPTMHDGVDERVKPYTMYRLQTGQKPVRLQ